MYYKAPFQQGDILYVRETWRNQPKRDGTIELQYRADFNEGENACYGRRGGSKPVKWHPSIHMPKKAARIWLKVTDVRVERLHDMNADDAEKEGIHFAGAAPSMYIHEFAELWDSTIKQSSLDLYGWDANPFVWVIEFEQCEKPEMLK